MKSIHCPPMGENSDNPNNARNCLIFLALLLGAVMWLKLGVLLLTVLFSYFVLDQLAFLRRKWLVVVVFLALMTVLGCGLGFGIERALRTLPKVAATSIPLIIHYASDHGIELPFSDWDSLKNFALEHIKEPFFQVGNIANLAAKELVFFLVGMVAAVSLHLSPAFHRGPYSPGYYTEATNEISRYFRSFYTSFRMVIGAQLIISSINTALTAIFIFSVSLPYAFMVVMLTFLFGLLPIVGNLLSNSIVVCIAFTVSPGLAIGSLVFLILLHKLEYFLNSKIIGERIKNPVWLTLFGLVIGERLLGITGMILAPVVLNFLKSETLNFQSSRPPRASA